MTGLEELSSKTYIGVEIEICVTRDYYEGVLGHHDRESFYQSSGSNRDWLLSDSYGNPYNRIILSQDMSCTCPEGMISAEIISPKCNKRNFPMYERFLLDKVFSRMDQLVQGGTCGIHVHWSNDAVVPKQLRHNDRFKFLLAYNMYRMAGLFDKYIRRPEFSGRVHHYSRPTALNVSNEDMDPDMIIVYDESTLFINPKEVVTLDSAVGNLEPDFEYYGIRYSKLVNSLVVALDKGKGRSLEQEIDSFLGHEGSLKLLSSMTRRMQLPWKRRLEEEMPENDKVKSFFEVLSSIDYFISKVHGLPYENAGHDVIEILYNSILGDSGLLPPFDEVLESINIDITGGLINFNKKAVMNIIDIDDMHFEFRVFSLDEVFAKAAASGAAPSPAVILDTIKEYIRLTERFCTYVIHTSVASFMETGGNKELLQKNRIYMVGFLYGRLLRKDKIESMFNRIFARPNQK